jgi:hypothetical protein
VTAVARRVSSVSLPSALQMELRQYVARLGFHRACAALHSSESTVQTAMTGGLLTPKAIERLELALRCSK